MLQSRVFNMSEEAWGEIEEKIDENFHKRVLNLIWWRYCFKCNIIRPPRSHHCSICDSCVMRMDHHCPWVGNCVGINNHKLFINFLFNSMMGCIIVACTMFHSIYHLTWTEVSKEMNYQAAMFLSCALIFSLGGLFGLHLFFIATNQSTLEMDALVVSNPFARKKTVLKSKKDREQRDPIQIIQGRRNNPTVVMPQNRQTKEVVSYFANMQDVLGENWRYWWLPVVADDRNADGYEWKITPTH